VIPRDDYRALRKVLAENSGHALANGKEYLVEQRLAPVAEALGFADLGALLQRLRTGVDPRIAKRVCEAMTTNESLFFRDGKPFDVLRDHVVPALLERRRHRRRLRIWSAGCSTGQEAYSIAMTLADPVPRSPEWEVEILGTDYSTEVVVRARRGVFNHFEVQRGLPIRMLVEHFKPIGSSWQVKDDLKKRVRFEEANLLDSFARFGTFDVIFCRNVLIYFDRQTRAEVLDRMNDALAPDGYLFLGSSETLLGVTDRWTAIRGDGTPVFRRANPEAWDRDGHGRGSPDSTHAHGSPTSVRDLRTTA